MGELGNLGERLKNLPDVTGVYLIKDAKDSVIYVGKAKSIKKRVPNHFKEPTLEPGKARSMRNLASSIDYISTTTEMEALILEDSLVKQYKPKFNIRLKDDKQYPLIFISTEDEFPRIYLVRKRENKKGIYFGPYENSHAVREIIKFVGRTFGIANCKKVFKTKGKPCLEYQLHNCLAPCIHKISKEDYQKNLSEAMDFLKGGISHLLEGLKKEMLEASEAMNYEKAAKIRDRIVKLEQLLIKQKIYFPDDQSNKDFLVLIKINGETLVERLRFRGGRLVGEEHFYLENTEESEIPEITKFFLQEEYLNNADIPDEIIVSTKPSEMNLLMKVLSRVKSNGRVYIRLPKSEMEKNLLELALKNGQIRIENEKRNIEGEELKRVLHLLEPIHRIEGYDISHLQGEHTVGSVVTFLEGKPLKSAYKRYKIKENGLGDDYGALRELISRRLDRYLSGDVKFKQLPDLILIDGGKGQLNTVLEVLDKHNLPIPVISLAKGEELIYSPHSVEPIKLPANSKALQLLQRVRDETHRFGLNYHHLLKEKLQSSLESLPGIGKKRAKIILQQVGSIKRLKSLTLEEILQIKNIPKKVLRELHEQVKNL